jgi:DNA-binding PadR family transcriptional regulator
MPQKPKRVADAVAETVRTAGEREPRGSHRPRRGGRPSDVFGGEIRRRDIFPLLVLHLISREPAYGNRLIEAIEDLTQGVISVNPNTMYPLLRELESAGLIEGRWEHPDKRTRRYYSITRDGRRHYKELVSEVEPFLDSVIRSVNLIKREIYGGKRGAGGKPRGAASQ